ncbi:alpha/beta fold hydrolase [Belnapia moabensis]|uniref:alpha/beta fold hydrolase n=1 Tax=Belnapia moabensis TaxID=365533 RepID=UPI000693D9D3|nr:alpha/beta fold hydrolase [Belnapia moabensis]
MPRPILRRSIKGTSTRMAEFLAHLDAISRRIETPCGEGRMAWRLWGEASSPPLVLLHGGSGSWRHWARNIEPLARERLVICPDLPGLGDSAMPPPSESPAPVAAILLAGLADILGPRHYDLCGFSFGALLAGHLAAQADARLRSVTLVGAGALGLPRQITPLRKVRSETGEARLAAHRHNLATLMFADPSRIDALALEIQEANTTAARFRSRGFASTTSLKDAIAGARAPVALLYGERDAIAFPEIDRRFAALREVQPEAWTGLIPGAGHWVAYEAAASFNAMLADMLARRLPGV